MKFNKYIDLDRLKMCAKEGIIDSCGQILFDFGILPDRYEKFASRWADIVIHNLPTEYIEQLTDAEAIGRTIGDYTNRYRQLTRSDFIDFIDYMLDVTAMPPKQNPGMIIGWVVEDIKKCCFEPDIDTYRKYRKLAAKTFSQLLIDHSVHGRMMPFTPDALSDNIHILTAYASWLITKVSNFIGNRSVSGTDFSKIPEVLYNITRDYVMRFGWDRFIEEADQIHMFLSPARELTRCIDRYFEEQIDRLVEDQIKRISTASTISAATGKVVEKDDKPYVDPKSGQCVGISKDKWDKLINSYVWTGELIITAVKSVFNCSSMRTTYTATVRSDNMEAELTYDQDGVMLNYSAVKMPGPLGGQPFYRGIGARPAYINT